MRPRISLGVARISRLCNDCRAFAESWVDRVCRGAPTIADGGYQGTGLFIPHRRRRGQTYLSPQQEAENTVHRRARARVEHALSRLKNWKSYGTAVSRATVSTRPCSASPSSTTWPSLDNSRPIRGQPLARFQRRLPCRRRSRLISARGEVGLARGRGGHRGACLAEESDGVAQAGSLLEREEDQPAGDGWPLLCPRCSIGSSATFCGSRGGYRWRVARAGNATPHVLFTRQNMSGVYMLGTPEIG